MSSADSPARSAAGLTDGRLPLDRTTAASGSPRRAASRSSIRRGFAHETRRGRRESTASSPTGVSSRANPGSTYPRAPRSSTSTTARWILSAPQSIRFRYLLEGSDTEWVDAGTRREAFYTNLRPQTYTFKVNVSDRDGGWTDNSSTISLIVQPTFTQTTWFYILIGCAGLCAIGGAWWLRLQAVRNRFATILTERARVAREIHDGLLQNLGSVAVELEVVTNELAGAPQPAVETLRQLRRRVTESVREARESIEHLRSTARLNGNIVTALNELATSVSVGKVQCTVASVRGTLRPCEPGIEEQLLRIAREAVGNAVRHGHATQIAIELEYQKDAVLLSVTDDGCGFDPHDPACATHGHWGIASMRERAASVGGSFTITSRPGEGTQVEAVVPIDTDSGPR